MKKEWTDKLKDRLSDYEENVPEGLWEDIESTLSRRMADAGMPHKRKTATMLRRIAAAITATAAAITVCYMLTTGSDTPGVETAQTATAAHRGSDTAIASAAPILTAGAQPAAPRTAAKAGNAHAGHDSGGQAAAYGNATTDAGSNAAVHETVPHEQATPEKSNSQKGGGNVNTGNRHNRHDALPATGGHNGNAGNRVSLGLYAQNLTMSTAHTPSQGSPMLYSMAPDHMAGDNAVDGLHNVINTMYSKQGTEILRIKHDFPIRAGLSVRYNLSSRIGIESGLTYTLLKSHITSGSEQRPAHTRRRLHYIGIPLNMSFTVWQGKRLEAYLSGGGEIQKCVSGKADTESDTGDHATPEAGSKIKDSRLQLSVSTAAGIQYNISPVVGIYAEPGISWYPDNGSTVETIYKEKPLNFSIKAGVRVNVR